MCVSICWGIVLNRLYCQPTQLWLWWNIPCLCGHTPTIVKSMSSDTDKTICKRCCSSDFLTSHPSIPISGLLRIHIEISINGVPLFRVPNHPIFIQFSQGFPMELTPIVPGFSHEIKHQTTNKPAGIAWWVRSLWPGSVEPGRWHYGAYPPIHSHKQIGKIRWWTHVKSHKNGENTD